MEENATLVTTQESAQTTPKKKSVALILCLLGGVFGAHKFYEGKILAGILYLITFGLFMVGVIFDLIKLIRAPSVYYVKKHAPLSLDAIVRFFADFPLEKIGRFVSGAGGIVVGLGASAEFNWGTMLMGLVIVAAGMAITLLKTRNLQETLVLNGSTAGILAVGAFALMLLIAAVIVYAVLKFALGIDLIEWIAEIFGDKEPSGENEVVKKVKKRRFPETMYDEQGNQYRLEYDSGDHADYRCPATGDTKQIWASDLEND